ncbi:MULTISPECIES: phosphoribosyltransferase domain-containing protein [Tenacibaculum]|uniref:phosphoribosyltransferase domain-containing protein n=1 Tax=Tenacibaculum TaxID=104267 RepID=UPI00089B7A76|nr:MULTISPECIES: phosphoribosyltransferase domain-containing protein [unclassified Tenacibaculum]RBW56552.1 phosphoribosyltransferase [Tenacibaculum sp. E3R01]SEE52222.1 pyrimidine operon attenuation protein / uracil phosphoribosyltransferase [Tenacibaculum sp. MAR_2010_89]
METKNNIILNNVQIEQKIKRIAYQIYESNSNEKEIVIAGITLNGFLFAKKLATALSKISSIEVLLCEVSINKKKPINSVTTSLTSNEYKNKALVLVDDVLNSGTTLIYGVNHFLQVPLKRFKTAVLVNRNHKKYPVKADFKGISLSTSIKEHVVVEFKDNETIAYLS